MQPPSAVPVRPLLPHTHCVASAPPAASAPLPHPGPLTPGATACWRRRCCAAMPAAKRASALWLTQPGKPLARHSAGRLGRSGRDARPHGRAGQQHGSAGGCRSRRCFHGHRYQVRVGAAGVAARRRGPHDAVALASELDGPISCLQQRLRLVGHKQQRRAAASGRAGANAIQVVPIGSVAPLVAGMLVPANGTGPAAVAGPSVAGARCLVEHVVVARKRCMRELLGCVHVVDGSCTAGAASASRRPCVRLRARAVHRAARGAPCDAANLGGGGSRRRRGAAAHVRLRSAHVCRRRMQRLALRLGPVGRADVARDTRAATAGGRPPRAAATTACSAAALRSSSPAERSTPATCASSTA
eukprot:356023-Chlamydomonas_euryale.AAC.3